MENRHEYVGKMLEKAMKRIDGKTMYDYGIIAEMNKSGVFFHFANEGLSYQFAPYN